MKRILGVKFSRHGQMYLFFCEDTFVVQGDHVLAETGQGTGIAEVAVFLEKLPAGMAAENVLPVLRKANEEDLRIAGENERLALEAARFCEARIRERDLDMKLVDVEMLFDRSKLVFYFTAPTRIDFRELVKDLVREYHTRIELRQIGVRHETQMLGAIGSCGMVCCCRRFLRKFVPVTIKMAKEQNLFLNPTKISGICGRLLCCLSYEQENYDLFHRNCPRLGKRYQTSRGPMRVLRANMFRNTLVVLTEANEELELSLDEWQEMDPRRPEASGPKTEGKPGHQRPPGEEFVVITADPDSIDRNGEDDMAYTGPGVGKEFPSSADPEEADPAADAPEGPRSRRKRKR